MTSDRDVRRAQRFMRRVLRGGADECWLWAGAKTAGGYGQLRRDGHRVYAHRYAYELEHGPIGGGFVVMHSCDTPACVNPKHLTVGTHADNVMDKMRKGRYRGTPPIGKTCRRGHEMVEANTSWYRSSHGTRRPRCRRCHADRELARKRAVGRLNGMVPIPPPITPDSGNGHVEA